MRFSALVETYMTSVERVFHYARNLPSEEDAGDGDRQLQVTTIPAWPSKGQLKVVLRGGVSGSGWEVGG